MKRCKHCGTELTSGYVICSDCVDVVDDLKRKVERFHGVIRILENDNYNAEMNLSHLTTEVDELKKQVDYYKAEKRALINDLKQAANPPCRYCKHNQSQAYCSEYCQYYYQDGKRTFPHFEWRGIKEEQAK